MVNTTSIGLEAGFLIEMDYVGGRGEHIQRIVTERYDGHYLLRNIQFGAVTEFSEFRKKRQYTCHKKGAVERAGLTNIS